LKEDGAIQLKKKLIDFQNTYPKETSTFLQGIGEDETEIRLLKPTDKNMNVKKAPGFDKITGRMLKELLGKALVHLTCIYRLKYVPEDWEKAQVLMIPNPGKLVRTDRSHFYPR
jgi:hypothetical protein